MSCFISNFPSNASCLDESEKVSPLDKKKPEKTAVYAVGRNDSGQLGLEHNNHSFQPKLINALLPFVVVKAACGLHHSVFLTDDGKVYSTGFNDNGQLGLGDKAHRNKPVLVAALEEERVVDIA